MRVCVYTCICTFYVCHAPTQPPTITINHNNNPHTDDPAVLFAVVLLSLRLTGGWEACDWANPLTRHQQPAAKRQEAPDSFTAAGQAAAPAPLLLPHSLEGLCALSAAEAAREDGGYPRWYRRVVLGALGLVHACVHVSMRLRFVYRQHTHTQGV